MGIEGVRISGGKMISKPLTLKLQKENEKEYATGKVVVWLKMLNDGMKPRRWNKPNKNGTAITFDGIHSQEDYETGLGELEGYISFVNKKYDLDLKLNKKEA